MAKQKKTNNLDVLPVPREAIARKNELELTDSQNLFPRNETYFTGVSFLNVLDDLPLFGYHTIIFPGNPHVAFRGVCSI